MSSAKDSEGAKTNSDIVIRSSDDVKFRLHKKNLECNSEAFPPAETPTNGEIVLLSETAATLKILFQFIYPRPYPNLEKLDVKSLLLVAEAAEKYRIFPAMYGCQFALRKHLNSNPRDILIFAVKHDNPSLIVQLPLKYLLDTPLSDLAEILSPSVYMLWTIYRERWLDALHEATTRLIPVHRCNHWSDAIRDLLCGMNSPSCLLSPKIDTIFGHRVYPSRSQCCVNEIGVWKASVLSKIAKIPPFSLPNDS
ncbi:hypothetical protein GYMLUDRAFT_73549 [Collybiopsis luxurians FD-317 M1]|uniref:Unplaced genomic scaffold GYMLUscaffold_24, whole genome shotgun sequence n=1 Tax=Collybiopsis luxurians FD-317 M1 TaxID=944289 RepID=A0A0D0CQ70_9AGAR|nr:hypothetical protein GYMLUDRAFT_73549 [Collybiopsis luxurians FD-317 M1]